MPGSPGVFDWLEQGASNVVDNVKDFFTSLPQARAAPALSRTDSLRARGYPDYVNNVLGSDYLEQFPGHTLPRQMEEKIPMYRADPTGRYGGKEGIETQPTRILAPELYGMARAMARARQYGAPQLSAQDLAALALKEGRSDFGFNGVFHGGGYYTYDPNDKADVELNKKLRGSGLNDMVSGFPVMLANKMRTAQRLGIPWQSAWNGTGKAISYGSGRTISSGPQYAADFPAFQKAAAHPRNAPLVKFLQDAMDAEYNPRPAPPRPPTPEAPSMLDQALHYVGLR